MTISSTANISYCVLFFSSGLGGMGHEDFD